jgi:pimeloyl-ACP methyl ester carboxylesterase
MAGMGPAVYLNHMRGPARFLAPLASVEKVILDLFGHGEILPEYVVKYINTYAPEFCTPDMKIEDLCENFFFILAGYDPGQTNKTELPVILAHTPTTSSTKTLIHFLQAIHSGKFRKYDYGGFRNKFIYGQWSPPKYDLSKVKVPVALYHASNDMLVDTKDVARLAGDLPNLLGSYQVNLTEFNHIDFLFAIDVDVLVNKPLLNLMETY